MNLRTFVAAALSLSLLYAAPAAQTTFLPLDEVKPGMIGVGRTVFAGTKLEDFKVEVLGVMRNVLAPKRNLILARLEGGPLAKTGVIAGMSGSPVYVDGRLIGAVSYSIGAFPKEPIAGITTLSVSLSSTRKLIVPRASTFGSSKLITRYRFFSLISPANPAPGSGILVNYDQVEYVATIPPGTPTPLTVSARLYYQTSSREYLEFLRNQAIERSIPGENLMCSGEPNRPAALVQGGQHPRRVRHRPARKRVF